MAASAMSAQEGFDDLADALDDYSDELAKVKKASGNLSDISVDTAKSLSSVGTALSKIFGVKVSNNTVAKNLDLI
jgi:hypothetical protein